MSAKKGAVVEWCPLCRVAFVESWPLCRGGHCREVANSGGSTVLIVITSRAVRAHVNVQGQVHRLFSEFCIPLACNHEIKARHLWLSVPFCRVSYIPSANFSCPLSEFDTPIGRFIPHCQGY